MTCWKCGKDIGEFSSTGICDGCEPPVITFGQLPPERLRDIDWGKIHTVDDLKMLLGCLDIRIMKGSKAEKKCERFLKP